MGWVGGGHDGTHWVRVVVEGRGGGDMGYGAMAACMHGG